VSEDEPRLHQLQRERGVPDAWAAYERLKKKFEG
jgi:hypothetical protein